MPAARPAREGVPDPELLSVRSGGGSRPSTSCDPRAGQGCSRPGEIGALLRREGLYTSHLTAWRKQRDAGALEALDRKRGRKPADWRDAENAVLRRRLERAEAELEKARRVIEVQGNGSALLGELLEPRGASRSTER